jgi:tRNA 2-thiouridine synthesizing protein E
MLVEINGESVQIDDEGYLVEPGSWNETVAVYLARQEDMQLTKEHWTVIKYMRSYYDQHSIAPDARFITKYLSNELGYGRGASKRLFELFPYGYVKQACKIAGMKRPRAWSTG